MFLASLCQTSSERIRRQVYDLRSRNLSVSFKCVVAHHRNGASSRTAQAVNPLIHEDSLSGLFTNISVQQCFKEKEGINPGIIISKKDFF